MTYKEAEERIEKNIKTSISKEYAIPFLFHLFTLDVFSEDRENGEHKHFVTVSFLTFRFISVCYRTGMNNYYAGTASKRNLLVSLLYGIWNRVQSIFYVSDRIYAFLDQHHFDWLVKNRYYDGRSLDADTAEGIVSDGALAGYKDIKWENNGLKCVLTTDCETERLMREGGIYRIRGNEQKIHCETA